MWESGAAKGRAYNGSRRSLVQGCCCARRHRHGPCFSFGCNQRGGRGERGQSGGEPHLSSEGAGFSKAGGLVDVDIMENCSACKCIAAGPGLMHPSAERVLFDLGNIYSDEVDLPVRDFIFSP